MAISFGLGHDSNGYLNLKKGALTTNAVLNLSTTATGKPQLARLFTE